MNKLGNWLIVIYVSLIKKKKSATEHDNIAFSSDKNSD